MVPPDSLSAADWIAPYCLALGILAVLLGRLRSWLTMVTLVVGLGLFLIYWFTAVSH